MQSRIGVFGLSRWSLPIGDSTEHELNLHDGLQFKCSLLLLEFIESYISTQTNPAHGPVKGGIH